MLIGIIGHMGHGKTTMIGEYLQELCFTRIHPATPIRSMLKVFLGEFGVSGQLADRILEGDLKREPLTIPGLEHLSGTSLQQSLGTAWGREEVHPDIWNMLVKRKLALDPRENYFNDSIRFPNEVDMVIEAKGYLVKIIRPGTPPDLSHESEQHIPSLRHHFEVINDDDFKRVACQMKHILHLIKHYPYDEFKPKV